MYHAARPVLRIMIRHWLRPLKSNLATSFLDENWIASNTDICIAISANLYIWLLSKTEIIELFMGINMWCWNSHFFLSLYVRTEPVQFRVKQGSWCSPVTWLCQLVTAVEELSARRINFWKIMYRRLTSLLCAGRSSVRQVVKRTLWEKLVKL